ncbi:MAG: SDR family NAD(P)-dependent oxidoreductase [Chloroflexota bacterium]
MTTLSQATILITGANGGFGQQMIRQFLAANGRLILTDVDGEALEKTAVSIQQATPSGEILGYFPVDLTSRAGCEKLFHQVESLDAPIDMLVNNAGIAHSGPFHEVPPEAWDKLLQLNLHAPMHLTRLFLPGLLARQRGHIVNIASIAGWTGPASLAAYSASKFGLRGFSESLMEETRGTGVEITAVYPFFSRTPILDSPTYGNDRDRDLPDNLVTDPADIVRAILNAVENNQQHLFPDKMAKRIQFFKRFAPKLLNRLNRLL